MQPYTRMYLTDYTCYASEGMFVSPFSDFNGVAYTPLGDVMVEYFEGRSQSGTPISPVSLQQMLDKLVGSARAINANGLLNVKISFGVHSKILHKFSIVAVVIFLLCLRL